MMKAQSTVNNMQWLKKVPGVRNDTGRLTVSLAESIALRACIKPATFPFKIWASYQILMLTKREHWTATFRRLPLSATT